MKLTHQNMFVYTILSALVFIMLPAVAAAWGPGTHIEIAASLLEKIALMAPAVRAVIAGREEWFLYGSVAADVVVGKKFAGSHEHCHNWLVAQRILKAAKTDRERSAAYGYLAHLAADIIAHNYYIPFSIIKSYRARMLSHTYWEMRFDMHVKPYAWDQIKKMALRDFTPFDALLKRVLKRALFSFGTSKRIFSGILILQRFKQFRKTFAIYAKRSRYKLDMKDISHYMRLAISSSLGYLADPHGAVCMEMDPIGTENIEYAHWVRWRIKKALRKESLSVSEVEHQLELIRKKLYERVARGLCSSFSQRP